MQRQGRPRAAVAGGSTAGEACRVTSVPTAQQRREGWFSAAAARVVQHSAAQQQPGWEAAAGAGKTAHMRYTMPESVQLTPLQLHTLGTASSQPTILLASLKAGQLVTASRCASSAWRMPGNRAAGGEGSRRQRDGGWSGAVKHPV